MPTATHHAAQPRPSGTGARNAAAVAAVTLGIFAIVTTEILPIGLLTSIASEFHISDGTAGLMMTMPGFLAALAAPAVTVTTARFDRRLMLCGFILLLAAADFLASAAPGYWAMLVSRVLVGFTIGGFWSIGAGLAARLVPAGATTRATTVIFAAVPLGSVLGVPLGTFLGDLAGWRIPFAAMGILSLGIVAALAASLPPLPAVHIVTADALRHLLRSNDVRFASAATFLIVLAHFGAYTYVTPFLQHVTDAGPSMITVLLLTYGVAGVAGNVIGGVVSARHPHAGFAIAGAAVACATALLPVFGRWDAGAVALLVVWGLGYGAVPVGSQVCFARSAPDAPEAASVLFTASFQATISAGALVGGVVVDRTSPATVMVAGGVVAAAMVIAVARHAAIRRTDR